MWRFLRILPVLGLVSGMVVLPVYSSGELQKAVAFLKLQTADAWTTQALAAAGEAEISAGHLKTVSGTAATDYAKTILALAAAGRNPSVYGSIDYVAKLETYYNSGQFGETSLLNDDIWSILALAAAGRNNTSNVLSARDYLIQKQNSDGGFGYAVGGESDTNDTAAAIMALVEAGLPAENAVVANAVSYLKAAQNTDGGFGWTSGSLSDSGSTAWVIAALNKIGANPESWHKPGGNPISFLLSLQDSDGGFWWMTPGASDFNNKAMTAFAVIALSGKSFPVGYYNQAVSDESPGFAIRIEGKTGTICDAQGNGSTVMDLFVDAAYSCGFAYNIEDTQYGPYIKSVNDETAAGLSGWLYLVNYSPGMVGAADYNLNEGDAVLFYFGEWGWRPIRLKIDKSAYVSGESAILTAEAFNGNEWLFLPGARIETGFGAYLTDENGKYDLSLDDGIYFVQAHKDGYIRSAKHSISFGAGVSQNIKLSAEIAQPTEPEVAGEMLIFEVSPPALAFGKINPGDKASSTIILKNRGTINLDVSAVVDGDELFKNNIYLDLLPWPNYRTALANGQNKKVLTELKVPAAYIGVGLKFGELVFWAKPD